jgi:hypothetical protein
MKIRIYSDLHLEFGRPFWPSTQRGDEELVVLAGDIAVGTAGVQWAIESFPHVPVVYVMGNHEYYRQDFFTIQEKCLDLAFGTNVHVLEREEALDIAGIRVLGCSLWTDYALLGEDRAPEAQDWAGQNLADHSYIRRWGLDRFTPGHAAEEFTENARWLDEQIAKAEKEGVPLLVVTHHSPTAATQNPYYQDQISNACFHSNADHLIRPPVRMWVHGHTHYNVDLMHQGVRIISNQLGYPREGVLGFRRDGLFTFDKGEAP